MKTNSIRQFLVEGQTESHLLKCLDFRGRVKIFNFWNTDIKRIIRTIKPNYCVCIIYDVDDINPKSLERFLANINSLAKNCDKIILLQQTNNLEDELIFSCQCKEKELLDLFNSCSRGEFKKKFLSASNSITLLENIGFDKHKLWSREIISEFEILISNKNIYFSNKHL